MKQYEIESPWLSPTEVSVYASVEPRRVYEAADRGELRGYVKPWTDGRKRPYLTFNRADVDDWVRTWPVAQGYKERSEDGAA